MPACFFKAVIRNIISRIRVLVFVVYPLPSKTVSLHLVKTFVVNVSLNTIQMNSLDF